MKERYRSRLAAAALIALLGGPAFAADDALERASGAAGKDFDFNAVSASGAPAVDAGGTQGGGSAASLLATYAAKKDAFVPPPPSRQEAPRFDLDVVGGIKGLFGLIGGVIGAGVGGALGLVTYALPAAAGYALVAGKNGDLVAGLVGAAFVVLGVDMVIAMIRAGQAGAPEKHYGKHLVAYAVRPVTWAAKGYKSAREAVLEALE